MILLLMWINTKKIYIYVCINIFRMKKMFLIRIKNLIFIYRHVLTCFIHVFLISILYITEDILFINI